MFRPSNCRPSTARITVLSPPIIDGTVCCRGSNTVPSFVDGSSLISTVPIGDPKVVIPGNISPPSRSTTSTLPAISLGRQLTPDTDSIHSIFPARTRTEAKFSSPSSTVNVWVTCSPSCAQTLLTFVSRMSRTRRDFNGGSPSYLTACLASASKFGVFGSS